MTLETQDYFLKRDQYGHFDEDSVKRAILWNDLGGKEGGKLYRELPEPAVQLVFALALFQEVIAKDRINGQCQQVVFRRLFRLPDGDDELYEFMVDTRQPESLKNLVKETFEINYYLENEDYVRGVHLLDWITIRGLNTEKGKN